MIEGYGLIFAILGLGLGIGMSYLLRRWRGTPEKKPSDTTPIVYASRQHARKAARERRKKH